MSGLEKSPVYMIQIFHIVIQKSYIMSQNHELLIAGSLSELSRNGSKCENFGNQFCNCGYCSVEG
jgi:hypothetical protein